MHIISYKRFPICCLCNPHKTLTEINYGCELEYEDNPYCIQCLYDSGILTDDSYEQLIAAEKDQISLYRSLTKLGWA